MLVLTQAIIAVIITMSSPPSVAGSVLMPGDCRGAGMMVNAGCCRRLATDCRRGTLRCDVTASVRCVVHSILTVCVLPLSSLLGRLPPSTAWNGMRHYRANWAHSTLPMFCMASFKRDNEALPYRLVRSTLAMYCMASLPVLTGVY
jgi:hypothetical protein